VSISCSRIACFRGLRVASKALGRLVECLLQRLRIYWPRDRLSYPMVDAALKCTYSGLIRVETRKYIFLDVILAIMSFS
jgi:hypothetical protein